MEAEEAETQLEKIKWHLWHGNVREGLLRARWPADDLNALESVYPSIKRFARTAEELHVYVKNNAHAIPNYGERVATSFVESTVNVVVGKRFTKRQEMQWSKNGAHLLLQTRTRTSTARYAACSSVGSPPLPTMISPTLDVLAQLEPPTDFGAPQARPCRNP